MTAEIGPVLRALPTTDVEVHLDERLDDAWLAAYRPDEGRAGVPEEVMRAVLTNHPAVVFASVRDGDRCVAIARVAVDGRWAGLSCVEVGVERRRLGLATIVSGVALRWAVSHGARRAYLQVTVDNTAARSLYDRLGFTVHHDYVYRSRT
jgi:ribosomal protein S18 acetylase RimI-like enzyme